MSISDFDDYDIPCYCTYETKLRYLIKEENSAYVSFKWSQEYVDGIKSLPVRYWIPSSKEWEIPINLVPLLNKIDKEIKEKFNKTYRFN